jgi:hypothetical protein
LTSYGFFHVALQGEIGGFPGDSYNQVGMPNLISSEYSDDNDGMTTISIFIIYF